MMNPILLDLPMPIRTPRLELRPPTAGTGAAMCEAVHESLENLKPWMNWAQVPPTPASSEEFTRRALAAFVLRTDLVVHIFERATGRFVGGSGWHRFSWENGIFEIGYWIRTSCMGKGYATEAVNSLTRYGFSVLGAKRIEVRVNAGNPRSQAVARKLGFKEEVLMKNGERFAPLATQSRDLMLNVRVDTIGLPELEVAW